MNKFIFSFFLLCSFSSFAGPAYDITYKPNIILMLIDDMGAECFRDYGNDDRVLPNIELMRDAGIMFEDVNVAFWCAPSRAMIMTGKHVVHHGAGSPLMGSPMDLTISTCLPGVLKDAGYTTHFTGKWNLYTGNSTQDPDVLAAQHAHLSDAGFDDYFSFHGNTVPETDHTVEANFLDYQMNQWVLQVMDEHYQDAEPFFIYYCFGMMKGDNPGPLDPTGNSGNRTDQQMFETRAQYLDDMVGNVRAKVADLGIQNNTLIILLGDNGTQTWVASQFEGETVYGGKQGQHKAGDWVPFFAEWPGTITPDSTYSGLVHGTDVFATLIEAGMGLKPSNSIINGRSFLAQMIGENTDKIRTYYINHFRTADPLWNYYVTEQLMYDRLDPMNSASVPIETFQMQLHADRLDALWEIVYNSLETERTPWGSPKQEKLLILTP